MLCTYKSSFKCIPGIQRPSASTYAMHMYTRTHTHTHTHLHNILFVLWCGVVQYDSTPLFPLFLAQWDCTALLRAAEGGSVPLVRALLEEYGSSVDEVTEVSCSSNVRCYQVTMSEVCLVAGSVQL